MVFTSQTHEWFADDASTRWAHRLNKENKNPLENLTAYVVRTIKSGEYNLVLVDNAQRCVIFETKSIEDMAGHIDMLRMVKAFNV